MLAYIKGEVAAVKTQSVVIDCNGLGFELLVPTPTAEEMAARIGENVKIHSYMSVKEDGITLFGFSSEEQLSLFKLLITVSGVGPKGALAILSYLTPEELRLAIIADDAKAIAKTPGIGSKTAGKMIIELKDKISLEDVIESKFKKAEAKVTAGATDRADAIEGLVALGYSSSEATKAVRAAEAMGINGTEALIKAALKLM